MNRILPSLAALAMFSSPAAAAAPARVDVCHVRGNGTYQLLTVSERALGAHLGHGDVLPGAWSPDLDGDGFGDASVTPSVCPVEDYVENAEDCDDSEAGTAPGQDELLDGADNDCDGLVDEGICPCFDETTLDEMTAGLDTEALSWEVRSNGLREVTSLRGYTWFYNEDAAQWQSPTVGADVYVDAGAPYCSTWSQTYLAAPDHTWADDAVISSQLVTETSFEACEDVLYDWIERNDVPYTAW